MKQFFADNPVIFATLSAARVINTTVMDEITNSVAQGADVVHVPLISEENTLYLADTQKQTKSEVEINISTLLTEFSEQKFNFEIISATSQSLSSLLAAIKQLKAETRVMLSAYSGTIHAAIRKVLPETAVSFSIMATIGLYTLFKTGLLHFKKKFSCDALVVPEVIGPSYLANQGFVRLLQKKGIKVYIRLDETVDQVKRLKAIDVNGFITNDPLMLQNILGE